MNIWGWLLAVCCAVTLGSCDDDDDLSASKVPDNVQVAFEAKFPAVNKVEWEKKSQEVTESLEIPASVF